MSKASENNIAASTPGQGAETLRFQSWGVYPTFEGCGKMDVDGFVGMPLSSSPFDVSKSYQMARAWICHYTSRQSHLVATSSRDNIAE
jgi:hypothetical protein